MPQITESPTREEWAARTEHARRRARFIQLLARAGRDVAKDLALTAEEWDEIAGVYLRAARQAEQESAA